MLELVAQDLEDLAHLIVREFLRGLDDLDDQRFLVYRAKVPDRPLVGQRYATPIKPRARAASN